MHEVFLLIGGNTGIRLLNISRALVNIHRNIGKITARSAVYETEPWGFEHETPFYNMVVSITTGRTADEILNRIHQTERKLGRIRTKSGYEARSIDIDILFYDDAIIQQPDLIIPHPKLHERRFTLIPLMDIDPEKVHPVFHKTIRQLNDLCPDDKQVYKLTR